MTAEIIGPFEENRVVVNGCAVPGLTANHRPDGTIELIIDRRLAIDIPESLFNQVAWLVANALAIGAGYSCHGENSRIANPYQVRVSALGDVPEPPVTPSA